MPLHRLAHLCKWLAVAAAIVALAALAVLALLAPDGLVLPPGEGRGSLMPLDPAPQPSTSDPSDASAVPVGQAATLFERSADRLLQDAEFVYGPAVGAFDTAAFLAQAGSPLASGSDAFQGTPRSLPEIIDVVARQHSLSPKLLIALLSMDGEAGASAAGRPAQRLGTMASWLSDGYYGLKYRQQSDIEFADGQRLPGPAEGGAAHFAVARFLARGATPATWPARLAAFAEAYDRLFGGAEVVDLPLSNPPVSQPPLLLPWPEGQRWHFTGGPHGAWGVATAWGAVDFAPPSMVGCRAAPEWAVAAAPGVVAFSADGLVLVDLDEDGDVGTGWVLAYLHMATADRVAAGTRLAAGDPVGHPSCEGGVADGAHVHFARRYNGEWLPAAGGPAPMDLSGWTFESYGGEYDGGMQHPSAGARMAVTSRRAGATEVVSDNGPARHAELAAAWASAARQADSGRTADAARGDMAPALPDGRAAAPASPPTPEDAPPPAPAGTPVQTAGDAALGGRPSLTIKLALDGRSSYASPLVIGLSRPDVPPAVLMARSDDRGVAGPIALPASIRGRYHVVVRVVGFMPAEHVGLDLGDRPVTVDFTGGGLIRLRAGELDLDRRIGPGDLATWLGLWWVDDPGADLDGDGNASLADLRRLLSNVDR